MGSKIIFLFAILAVLVSGVSIGSFFLGQELFAQEAFQAKHGMPMGMRPSGQPGDPGVEAGKESGGEKEKDGKKEGEKDGEKGESPEPKVVRRDQNIDDDANADELKATVGEDGRVAFQFRNQPWVELVQWLAEISDKPLDWLELPGDRVNLSSPRRYTVAETRDLFNRYLLARGYVILDLDGGLTVAKTNAINSAIVPRVDPEELESIPPHTFVRTSLDVAWLSAEKLAEELKPMISSNGQLTAFSTTNRIEVMDAAINVRQVAELLKQEGSSNSREALAPEFKLRYVPAEEAKRMLEEFLGVAKEKPAPLSPEQIQMMRQMRGQGGGQKPQAEKKVEISIVANTRQNSVIIRAPEDRVAIAAEFVKRIDVPSNSLASLADVEKRVEVFRLASLDPEKLVEIIGEMNILEPATRMRTDKDNNALIVSGSPADRFIIQSLIERLDGSGRSFHVLQLRRLEASEVTESIAFLMGQEKDDKQNNSRRSYSFWGGYGDDDQDKEKDEFRVAANNRYRQVLLWANPIEMEQVESLLIKLGELPPPGGSDRTVRVIDASATLETLEYLKRLKQQWNQLSPNPLELPDPDEFIDPSADADADADADAAPDQGSGDEFTHADSADSNSAEAYQLAIMQPPGTEAPVAPTEKLPEIRSRREFDRLFGSDDPSESKSDKPPAAIRIELDSSGNLVLSSADTKALDRLENLMLQVAPPKRPYHVLKVKNTTAYWMRLNLEEYFDEEDDDNSDDSFYRWYWGEDNSDDEDPAGLGKGAKLKFIDDIDTNTIVVTGASTDQLRTIKNLIELWDVAEPVNQRKARYTKLVPIKYGKADKVAETVKEAYRDLLSSNDKTFRGGGGGDQRQQKEASRNRDGNGSGLVESEGGRDAGGADFSFKGKLSLGVDEVGNSLLVSTEGEPLLELVCEMISKLDDAAKPSGEVEVINLPGEISAKSLETALKAFGAVESVGNDNRDQRRPNRGGDGRGGDWRRN
ncbi:secretin N-terminal domain-containing protein [Novipirellula herctigrandis]|uniref:secretin N-terminal domain-containing protein n=1 Tax=Novipirellula herctigrandis TaxID=2527986 RepID=UPI003AF3371D